MITISFIDQGGTETVRTPSDMTDVELESAIQFWEMRYMRRHPERREIIQLLTDEKRKRRSSVGTISFIDAQGWARKEDLERMSDDALESAIRYYESDDKLSRTESVALLRNQLRWRIRQGVSSWRNGMIWDGRQHVPVKEVETDVLERLLNLMESGVSNRILAARELGYREGKHER